jgi:hypothetical protein
MNVEYDRFHAAAHRLASRRMVRFWKLEGPFPPSIVDRLMNEVSLPWAITKLAKACWKRGWEIDPAPKVGLGLE